MSFDPVSYAMGRAAAPGGTDVSDTTATAADVLSAKAFYLADGTKTQGSIASKAAQTYTPTTADQTIAAGQYLAGAQTVKGDANLVAGNIKKDVTIFGVTGSHEGGGGGNQPTLFAPNLYGGINTMSWDNSSSNGMFPVSLAANVEGTPVTSPLTITEQMHGKTLTVTASSPNFVSSSSTTTLNYVSLSKTMILPSNYTPDAENPYIYLKFQGFEADSDYRVLYNGTEYILEISTDHNFLFIPIDLTQDNELDLEIYTIQGSLVYAPFITFLKTATQHSLVSNGAETGMDRIMFSYAQIAVYNSNDTLVCVYSKNNSTYLGANASAAFSSDPTTRYHFRLTVTF